MRRALLPPPLNETTVRIWDPLSRVDASSIVGAGAVWALGYVIVLSVISADEVDDPALAILGVLLAAAALGVLVHATRPGVSSVSARKHVVVITLAFAAAVLGAAGSWSSNSSLRDEWGPVLLGVVTMLLAVHRPPRELAFSGVVVGVQFAFVVLLQATTSGVDHGQPLAVLALQVMVPAIALPLGGAAFGSSLIAALARWQASSSSAHRAEAAGLDAGIARSVQQGHVSLLNAEVVPFLSGLLERDAIGPGDRVAAQRIADSVRRHLLEDADRTWLDALLAEYGGAPVDDPDRRSSTVPEEERAVVRALMRLLVEQPEYEAGSLRAAVLPHGDGFAVRFAAVAHASEQQVQLAAAPYLAALRRGGTEVLLEQDAPRVAVQLNHGGD